jgi:hypothetical protein
MAITEHALEDSVSLTQLNACSIEVALREQQCAQVVETTAQVRVPEPFAPVTY